VGQFLRGRPAAKNVDYAKWNEYRLCRQWGCTPSQLKLELNEDVYLHLAFMEEEVKAEIARRPRR